MLPTLVRSEYRCSWSVNRRLNALSVIISSGLIKPTCCSIDASARIMTAEISANHLHPRESSCLHAPRLNPNIQISSCGLATFWQHTYRTMSVVGACS